MMLIMIFLSEAPDWVEKFVSGQYDCRTKGMAYRPQNPRVVLRSYKLLSLRLQTQTDKQVITACTLLHNIKSKSQSQKNV
jgi:hypothetical protein